MSIGFSYLDSDKTQLLANVSLDLAQKTGMVCSEHLQFSTSFSDHYDYFMIGGHHEF